MTLSDHDFQTFFDLSGIGMFLTSPDGSLLRVNKAVADLLGYPLEELLGRDFQSLTHPDDLELSVAGVRQMLAGEREGLVFEKRYLRKNGEPVWTQLTTRLLRDADGEPRFFLTHIQDLTDQRAALAALEESESRYRLIFENMGEGFGLQEMVSDDQGRSVDFRFLELNAAYERHTGLSRDKALGRTIREVLPTVDPAQIEAYGRVAFTGVPLDFEYRSRSFNRDFRVRAFQPSYGRFATIFEDVTETRENQAEILRQREKMAVTLRSIGDGVITTDLEGRVELLNPVAEHLTGWTEREAQGRPLSEVFVILQRKTREPAVNPVAQAIATGQTVDLANHTVLVGRHGQERAIADSAAPIRGAEGVVLGAVLVFRDVTEQEHLQEQLRRTEQLESIGSLAGGIAHDFNNLLAGLFSSLELARLYIGTDHKAFRHLERAFQSFHRAKDLTKQLLTFSKGGAPVRTPGSLGAALREVVSFALSGSAVAVSFEIPETLSPADFDANQLSQVIENLTINAQQAMKGPGNLTVRAYERQVGAGDVPLLAPGAYLVAEFEDDGPGVPDGLRDDLFKPFVTSKAGGSGLGLATSYSILKKHDGLLMLDPRAGAGALFRFYLPVSTGSVPVETAPAQPQPQPFRGSGRILVMDDDAAVRESFSEQLEVLGFETVQAHDGETALRFLAEARRRRRPFRAAFFDLTVPGALGGLDAMIRARRTETHLPIFVVSGYSEDPVQARPREFGFTGALTKPFAQDELVQLLRRWLSPV